MEIQYWPGGNQLATDGVQPAARPETSNRLISGTAPASPGKDKSGISIFGLDINPGGLFSTGISDFGGGNTSVDAVVLDTDVPEDKHIKAGKERESDHALKAQGTLQGNLSTKSSDVHVKQARIFKGETENFKGASHEDVLNQIIDHKAELTYDSAIEDIQDVRAMRQKDKDIRVVNMSMGHTRTHIYEDVYDNFQEQPENFGMALGLSAADQQNDEKVRAAIVHFVDSRLDAEGSVYQQKQAQWQGVTRQVADEGLVLVVASHNEQADIAGTIDENGQHVPGKWSAARQGAGYNFLAQSDHVISVAAANQNGTPDNLSDDTIAAFSSQGDGRYNPTIAANGVNVDTHTKEESHQRRSILGIKLPGSIFGIDLRETAYTKNRDDGTSFAAPTVSAAVMEMLKANPELSFEEVQGILQSTAVDTRYSAAAEGAGMMDRDAAIHMAKSAA